MPRFADEREAKEFVIGLIVSEAEREGIPLSEPERKILYFSETGWTLPDMAETAQHFDSDCDSEKFESKVSALVKRLQKRLTSEDPETLKAWSDGLRKLSKGDHYLLVLVPRDGSSARPPHDFLKLCITALVIVLAGGALMTLLPKHSEGRFGGEEAGFIIWLVAAMAVSACVLLSLIIGREKAKDLFGTWISKVFGDPAAKR